MGTLQENIIYNNIKRLCDNSVPRVSFSKMCVDLGLSKSLGTKLKENPEKTINSETAQKIADYFGVSVDRVLGTEQKEKAPANAEAKDEYEISHFMEALESSGTLMYDGVPISDAAKDSIRAAMRLGLEAAKIESKKKFTPKKYRKD